MFFTNNHVECIASGATIEYTINVLRVHSFFFFFRVSHVSAGCIKHIDDASTWSCFSDSLTRFRLTGQRHSYFFRRRFIFSYWAVCHSQQGIKFSVDQTEPRPNGFPVEYRVTVNILSELSQRVLYAADIYDRILRGVCIWIFAFSLAASLMPVFLCLWAQSHPAEPLPVMQIKRSD